MSPGKDLVGIEIVAPRDFGDRRTIREALLDDPTLLVRRPELPPAHKCGPFLVILIGICDSVPLAN